MWRKSFQVYDTDSPNREVWQLNFYYEHWFGKRLVHHTVTVHIHINVSSHSIFLVWSGTAELQVTHYSVCEGRFAGLEAKALVWKWNSGTSSHSIFLVWKRNYGTSKHYSLCGGGMSDLKFTQHSMCGSGT